MRYDYEPQNQINVNKDKMILYYKTKNLPGYWDDIKEDYISEYWLAYIVSGLEDYCTGKGVRPKDLVVSYGFKGQSEKEALDKLINELHNMGMHGVLKRG